MPVSTGLGAELLNSAVRDAVRASAAAPTISVTATGPIQLRRGTFYVAPATKALSMLQALHYQAAGDSAGARNPSAAITALTPQAAFTVYSKAVVGSLAQLAASTTAGRTAQLSAMLDYCEATRDLSGLEGPFLSAVRAAQDAQDAGATDLVNRAQELWSSVPLGSSIGGGALSVPVLDPATGQLTLLGRDDLVHLGAGESSATIGGVGTSLTSQLELLGKLGGLGRAGAGLNQLGGVFSGSLDISGATGRGLAQDATADNATKGAALGGILGCIVGGIIGGVAGTEGGAAVGSVAGPAGAAAGGAFGGLAGVLEGAEKGSALGVAFGAAGGVLIGWIYDKVSGNDAQPPAEQIGTPMGGGGTGGSGRQSGGQAGPAPSGGGTDGSGRQSGGQAGPTSSGGDGQGQQSSDGHPAMPQPEDDADDDGFSYDAQFGGRSGGYASLSVLIPDGDGIGALTAWQGGNSFVIHGLPQIGDDGQVNYGFLGAAGAAILGAAGAADSSPQGVSGLGTIGLGTFGNGTAAALGTARHDGAAFSAGSTTVLPAQLSEVTTESVGDMTVASLQSMGHQLLAIAAQAQTRTRQ
jgi:hypothetical protein